MNPTTATDLSQFHQPIAELFPRLQSPEDKDAFALSDQQIKFYRENGYLVGPQLLNPQQIEVLRGELAEFFQPEHPGHEFWYEYHTNESPDPDMVLFHALGAWRIRSGFHDLLWNPAFTVPASQLLGGAVRFWHDQLFCKPARHGGVVAWHQDYSYWTRTEPMAHLTCWIALDDVTVDRGCLQYIPGSHKWDLLPITGLAGDMEAIREVLSDKQWEQMQNPRAIEVKAGQCTFHHPLMVHGSFANRTDQPRRAAVINVVRDGVHSVADEPLLEGTPVIPSGQPLDGQFFPLLLSEQES
jgi:ectoine hydroxylase-related dioxygenase (phytanoyl-CoA dioxygenase family)